MLLFLILTSSKATNIAWINRASCTANNKSISEYKVGSQNECQDLCALDPKCETVSFEQGSCLASSEPCARSACGEGWCSFIRLGKSGEFVQMQGEDRCADFERTGAIGRSASEGVSLAYCKERCTQMGSCKGFSFNEAAAHKCVFNSDECYAGQCEESGRCFYTKHLYTDTPIEVSYDFWAGSTCVTGETESEGQFIQYFEKRPVACCALDSGECMDTTDVCGEEVGLYEAERVCEGLGAGLCTRGQLDRCCLGPCAGKQVWSSTFRQKQDSEEAPTEWHQTEEFMIICICAICVSIFSLYFMCNANLTEDYYQIEYTDEEETTKGKIKKRFPERLSFRSLDDDPLLAKHSLTDASVRAPEGIYDNFGEDPGKPIFYDSPSPTPKNSLKKRIDKRRQGYQEQYQKLEDIEKSVKDCVSVEETGNLSDPPENVIPVAAAETTYIWSEPIPMKCL